MVMVRVLVILTVQNIRGIKLSRLISTHLDSLVPSFDTISGLWSGGFYDNFTITVNNLNLDWKKQDVWRIDQTNHYQYLPCYRSKLLNRELLTLLKVGLMA